MIQSGAAYRSFDVLLLDILGSQILRPGLAFGVEVRLFADTNSPMTEPLTKTLVVKGSSVERAAVVPDSYYFTALAKTNLAIKVEMKQSMRKGKRYQGHSRYAT